MINWFLKVPKAIGVVVFVAIWAIAVMTFIVGVYGVGQSADVELPLSDVNDVAVDSQGRIYVMIGAYHRIQRYSAEGEFQLGWHIPTAGASAICTTPDDRVKVAAARRNKLFEYTCDGRLLSSVSDLEVDFYEAYKSESDTRGPYQIDTFSLPRIVDSQSGKTVIETRWPLWLVTFPFPLFAIAFGGFALFALAELAQKKLGISQLREDDSDKTRSPSGA